MYPKRKIFNHIITNGSMAEKSGPIFEICEHARHFLVEFVIHLFLHNCSVLNSNLPDDILYSVFFTFKLAKKNGRQNINKTTFIYGLSHRNAQFIVFIIMICSR